MALGPEAPPLLLPYLESSAGRNARARATRERAQAVAEALSRMPTGAVVGRLLELARTGPLEVRLHALGILGGTGEPRRVGSVLIQIFQEAPDQVRLAALRALARLGGEENLPVIRQALRDPNPSVVAGALAAAAEGRLAELAPVVRDVAKSREASSYVPQILDYYTGCPATVDDQVVDDLIRLATHPRVQDDDKLLILDRLPTYGRKWDRAWRITMDPLVSMTNTSVGEEALICLARLGDRNSKREVLRIFDDRVDRNDRFPGAYRERADLLVRLGEYSQAIRDYDKSIDLTRSGPEYQVDMWIGKARAYVFDGNLREAGFACTVAQVACGGQHTAMLVHSA